MEKDHAGTIIYMKKYNSIQISCTTCWLDFGKLNVNIFKPKITIKITKWFCLIDFKGDKIK